MEFGIQSLYWQFILVILLATNVMMMAFIRDLMQHDVLVQCHGAYGIYHGEHDA